MHYIIIIEANHVGMFACPTLLIEPLALHPLNVLEVLHGVSGLKRGSQSLQKLLHHHLVFVHPGGRESAEVLQDELFPAKLFMKHLSLELGHSI